jgi:hypothetical protein
VDYTHLVILVSSRPERPKGAKRTVHLISGQASRAPFSSQGEPMGLQVLLVDRLRPELGVSGHHEGIAVADVRHPAAVQEAVARLGDDEGALLVVCSSAAAVEVRHQLAMLAVAVPVTTVLEIVPGSSLAVWAAATAADDSLVNGDLAEQLATFDVLRDRLWSAVWLPRVAKLSTPAPSLVQHVRGWFPGAGFLAVAGPQPRVLNASSAPLPDLDAPTGSTLFVADDGAPAWVVDAVTEQLAPSDRIDTTTWRDARDAYGVERSVELVAVPDFTRLDSGGAGRAVECPACGRRHPRRVCPFCRMAAPAVGTDLAGAQS